MAEVETKEKQPILVDSRVWGLGFRGVRNCHMSVMLVTASILDPLVDGMSQRKMRISQHRGTLGTRRHMWTLG